MLNVFNFVKRMMIALKKKVNHLFLCTVVIMKGMSSSNEMNMQRSQVLSNACNLVSLFIVLFKIFGKFTHACINTNSLQRLEHKLLGFNIDKVVNDEWINFFQILIELSFILISARNNCYICQNFMFKYECGVKI